MPLVVRRQPSLDLRKAARAARDAAFDHDLDSYPAIQDSLVDTLDQLPASPRKARLGRDSLRLSISSPTLHHQYLSDEEQASPVTARDEDSTSGCFEDLSDPQSAPTNADAADEANDYRNESAFSDTEGTDLSDIEEDDEVVTVPAPRILTAAALAIAVPILAVGRPRLVKVSSVAPPQKRQTPIDPRPAARIAGSLAIMRRFRAPVPTENALVRGPESPQLDNNDAASFRTAASSADSTDRYAKGNPDRVDSLTPPGHSHSDSSASESSLSSSITEADALTAEPVVHEEPSAQVDRLYGDDGGLCLRDAYASAGQIKVSHFHQQPFELPPSPPTRRRIPRAGGATAARSSFIENFDERPLSYSDYDPFALQPPTLRADEAADTASPPASPRLRRWKGMGMARLGRKSSRRWGFAGTGIEGVRV